MRLTKISEIRRRELRRAAFEVLQKEGMAGATLEKVAMHAGASKGIVLHYFANKQELFEHAMREANAALKEAVVTESPASAKVTRPGPLTWRQRTATGPSSLMLPVKAAASGNLIS